MFTNKVAFTALYNYDTDLSITEIVYRLLFHLGNVVETNGLRPEASLQHIDNITTHTRPYVKRGDIVQCLDKNLHIRRVISDKSFSSVGSSIVPGGSERCPQCQRVSTRWFPQWTRAAQPPTRRPHQSPRQSFHHTRVEEIEHARCNVRVCTLNIG